MTTDITHMDTTPAAERDAWDWSEKRRCMRGELPPAAIVGMGVIQNDGRQRR